MESSSYSLDTSSSPGLQKARQLAKNNPQLARKLDPDKKPHPKIKARQKRLKQAVAGIQKFYGEEIPKSSMLLVKPDSKDPLSIPLSRQKQLLEEKNYKEVEKMAISDLKNALNKDFSQNNHQTKNHQNENVENTSGKVCGNVENYSFLHDGYASRVDNTLPSDVGVVVNMISFDEYKAMEEMGEVGNIHIQQNNYQTQFPQTDGNKDNTETIVDNMTTTSTEVVDNKNIVVEEEKLPHSTTIGEEAKPKRERGVQPEASPTPRRRGRPRKEEKVSLEKLSQYSPSSSPISSPIDIPEDYAVIPLKVKSSSSPVGVGKTSLTYLSIYTNSLTPEMLSQVLSSNPNELPLTIAEIMALKLMKKALEDDKNAEKLYWDLQKTLEKNKKPNQIRKTETTLLQQKLAEAKTAILSEKPIDGKSDSV